MIAYYSNIVVPLYGQMKSDLLADRKDLKFTAAAIEFIFLSTNEFYEDPRNQYAKGITLDMFGKLLKVYRVGDGTRAEC